MNIPKTTKSRAANNTAPLPKLPPLSVEIDSALSFDQAVEELKYLFFSHWSLVRVIAGTIIRIPEIETKVFLAHSLFLHAEIAGATRRRLVELRVRDSKLCVIPQIISAVCNELLYSDSAAEFVFGYSALVAHLAETQSQYIQRTSHLLDRPSVLIMRRFAPDIVEVTDWLETARSAYVAIDFESQFFETHITAILKSRSSDGCPSPMLRQDSREPYQRTNECARDGRFALFHQSRQYSTSDGLHQLPDDKYGVDRLELARVQRDEIDAIETFANVLFDLDDAPFELVEQLARFVEDEARHVETGHAILANLGHDPFEIPCSIIGINVRAPMPPVLAFAQLNIFGELNIVSRLNVMAQQAYARDDDLIGKAFDFVHADELTHVRRGRKLLIDMAPGENPADVSETARRLAARRLAEEGVLGEDYALALTRKQVGELMGE
ncbi:ferritin-like domain-containing protein [Parasedimentitalea marina]|uniref:Ferritin-like domain-containing protein n=1 Tax=Parasedimentitalea marina TaxID=2483033 RepID=A0A3T0N4T6_9RHOB|nr:ferritin-like domain-containing protein [Parasedimentitalea marina]AZV79017.1 ferritin-like domain-containing protein [Parasedimentitalea marina]